MKQNINYILGELYKSWNITESMIDKSMKHNIDDHIVKIQSMTNEA